MNTIGRFLRLRAWVNRIRAEGLCGMSVIAEIDRSILEERELIEPHMQMLGRLEQLKQVAITPLCRLKQPLESPEPGFISVALFDCDEVHFAWYNDKDGREIPFTEWPVDQSFVLPEDLERLGFKVDLM